MDFNYIVTTSRSINIDFQDIFDYIRSKDLNVSIRDIYYNFIDNVGDYLRFIYKCEDFDEDLNDYEINELIISWKDWFNEIFGENWDEI